MPENIELNVEKLENTAQHLETQQLIVFRQGNEEYGLHIDQIREVVLTPNITKMPQTPPYVKGVANIRGNIIGIIDLEEKFGIKEMSSTTEANKANKANNYTLVIESDEVKIGILVGEVPNTLTVKSSEIEQSVNIIHDNSTEPDYIQGMVKLEGRLIIMIDIFKVLDEQDLGTTSPPNDKG